MYEGRDAAGLDRLQKRLVEKVYKDFVRSGANLTAEQKRRIQGDKQPAFGTDFPFREKPARRERAFPDGAE